MRGRIIFQLKEFELFNEWPKKSFIVFNSHNTTMSDLACWVVPACVFVFLGTVVALTVLLVSRSKVKKKKNYEQANRELRDQLALEMRTGSDYNFGSGSNATFETLSQMSGGEIVQWYKQEYGSESSSGSSGSPLETIDFSISTATPSTSWTSVTPLTRSASCGNVDDDLYRHIVIYRRTETVRVNSPASSTGESVSSSSSLSESSSFLDHV